MTIMAKKIPTLAAVLMAGMSFSNWAHGTTLRTEDVVAAFDLGVASGLPFTLDLPVERAREKRDLATEASAALTIDAELPVSIGFPDESQGRLFRGTYSDSPVVLTRRNGHIDISQPQEDGMHVAGYSAGESRVENIVIPDVGGGTPGGAPLQRSRRSEGLPEGVVSRSVKLNIFVHDDIKDYMTPAQIHAGYVAWWLSDAIGSALPFVRFDVSYHAFVEGITNIPYMHSRALQDWTHIARSWAEAEDIDFDDTHLNKFMLVTLLDPQPGVTGIAWQEGNAALSAITGRYRIVAHELGHLFGATHDNAKLAFRWAWYCESNMYPAASAFRANCYTYSDENMRRMRAYIVEGPRSTGHADRGPAVIN